MGNTSTITENWARTGSVNVTAVVSSQYSFKEKAQHIWNRQKAALACLAAATSSGYSGAGSGSGYGGGRARGGGAGAGVGSDDDNEDDEADDEDDDEAHTDTFLQHDISERAVALSIGIGGSDGGRYPFRLYSLFYYYYIINNIFFNFNLI